MNVFSNGQPFVQLAEMILRGSVTSTSHEEWPTGSGIHLIDFLYLLRKEARLLQRAVSLAVAEACAHIEMKIL